MMGKVAAVDGLNLVRRSPRPSRLPVSYRGRQSASAPAGLRARKDFGEGDLSLLKLRAGGGAHQRTDVGQHGQVLLIEQSLHLGEFGMKSESEPALGGAMGSRLACGSASTERICW